MIATHLMEKLLPAAMSTITDPSPGVEIDGVVVCPRTRGAKRAIVHITCMFGLDVSAVAGERSTFSNNHSQTIK